MGKWDKVKDQDRFSIIVDDLTRCIHCGTTNVELHEIFEGAANRPKSKEDGMVIPACRKFHNKFHKNYDRNVDLYFKKMAQKIWMDYYNKTEEDFIERYGQNYLLDESDLKSWVDEY